MKSRVLIVKTAGKSMFPLIMPNSRLIIIPNKPLKTGDIAVYRSRRKLIAHRVICAKKNFILTGGDRNPLPEQIKKEFILGKVDKIIYKDGRTIDLNLYHLKILNFLRVIVSCGKYFFYKYIFTNNRKRKKYSHRKI